MKRGRRCVPARFKPRPTPSAGSYCLPLAACEAHCCPDPSGSGKKECILGGSRPSLPYEGPQNISRSLHFIEEKRRAKKLGNLPKVLFNSFNKC